MVPRENKNNAYAKFRGTNKEYYGIFLTGLLPRVNKQRRGFKDRPDFGLNTAKLLLSPIDSEHK